MPSATPNMINAKMTFNRCEPDVEKLIRTLSKDRSCSYMQSYLCIPGTRLIEANLAKSLVMPSIFTNFADCFRPLNINMKALWQKN